MFKARSRQAKLSILLVGAGSALTLLGSLIGYQLGQAGGGLLPLLGAGALLAALIVASLLVSKRVSKPITTLTNLMIRLIQGDTEVELPFKERPDEIGRMAQALEIMRVGFLERQDLIAQKEAARESAHKDQMRLLSTMESQLREKTEEVVVAISGTTEIMTEVAGNMVGWWDPRIA